MYDLVWVVLFATGVLLSIGAYVGYARGFSALLSIPVWFIIGTGASSLTAVSNGSTVAVPPVTAVTWLAYLNAAISLVALLVAIQEYYANTNNVN